MSSSPAAGSRLLSVSIVSGASTAALLQKVGATETKHRLGLLTSAQAKRDNFIVQQLSLSPEGHGPDPAQVVEQIIAISNQGAVDHLFIECDPETPAFAFASLFVPQDNAASGLTDVAWLTSTVLAIDPATLLDALVQRREIDSVVSPCLLAEQLEFVNNVVLDGSSDDPNFKIARLIALTLNPRAHVSPLSPATSKKLLDAGTAFDFAAALDGAGWRKLIESEQAGPNGQDHVTAFAFRARKPFHPEKFWNLLQGGFPNVIRAKGFFWIATRMDLVGGLNLAGSESHYATAGEWWAARDEQTRHSEMPERTRKEWREPFGDRRQAIAFMGLNLDAGKLKAELDACLLSDSEMTAGESSWAGLPDPFPSWSTPHHHHHDNHCDHDHGHAHEHEHECDDGDCHHHH
jgi:G3E family GTPase